MTTTQTEFRGERFNSSIGRRLLLVALLVLAIGGATGCSSYASLSVGVPMRVGPMYVTPSIGVGGYL